MATQSIESCVHDLLDDRDRPGHADIAGAVGDFIAAHDALRQHQESKPNPDGSHEPEGRGGRLVYRPGPKELAHAVEYQQLHRLAGHAEMQLDGVLRKGGFNPATDGQKVLALDAVRRHPRVKPLLDRAAAVRLARQDFHAASAAGDMVALERAQLRLMRADCGLPPEPKDALRETAKSMGYL